MNNLVTAAKYFALYAHREQMYGHKPYGFHLEQVANCFGPNEHFEKAVAWLHDTVEDTKITENDIRAKFGNDVERVVFELTKPDGMEYTDYIKRIATIKGSVTWRVKMADLTCNLTSDKSNMKHERAEKLNQKYMNALKIMVN